MKTLRWTVLGVALVLLGACQDRRDPIKPTTVIQIAIPVAVST